MKKYIAILLAVLMAAALMACGAKDKTAEPEQSASEIQTDAIVNPITEYDTLDEVNELTGSRLTRPAEMEVADEKYYIIADGEDKIAEYDFTVSGIEYSYRFSGTNFADISGIYKDGKTLFNDQIENAAAEFEGGKAARFFTVDGQYILTVMDNGAYDMAQFEEIANAIFAGAIQEPADGDVAGLPNPMTEYDTLDEINELTNGHLTRPAVMGVTDEHYFIIDNGEDKIAQYDFTVSGIEYSYRFSDTVFDDISGIYKDGKTLFEGPQEDAAAEFDGGHAARTFTVEGQYVLTAKDNGTYDLDQFLAIADEIFAGARPQLSAEGFAGEWHEIVAGRATLTAEADGDELTVEIQWPNSAEEVFFWSFSGKVGEDGTVAYTNGIKKSVVYNDQGTETETVLAEDCEGYLLLNVAGNIEWGESEGDRGEPAEFTKN